MLEILYHIKIKTKKGDEMLLPTHIKKRDGKIDQFEPMKIREAIFSAVKEVRLSDSDEATENIYQEVKKRIRELARKYLEYDAAVNS